MKAGQRVPKLVSSILPQAIGYMARLDRARRGHRGQRPAGTLPRAARPALVARRPGTPGEMDGLLARSARSGLVPAERRLRARIARVARCCTAPWFDDAGSSRCRGALSERLKMLVGFHAEFSMGERPVPCSWTKREQQPRPEPALVGALLSKTTPAPSHPGRQ